MRRLDAIMNAVKISRLCSVNGLPLGVGEDCMLMAVYLTVTWKILSNKIIPKFSLLCPNKTNNKSPTGKNVQGSNQVK